MARPRPPVFVDTGPFALETGFPQDPRTAVNRRFLEQIRSHGNGVTGLGCLLEWAGVMSYRISAEQLENGVRYFQARFGVRLWPASDGLSLGREALLARISRRMNMGDALVLLQAEECLPRCRTLVTWNPQDFAGRTDLAVRTPQQFLRGG